MSKSNDLSELLNNSSSTREYFVSLPVDLQMHLHEHYNSIHTLEQLRFAADVLKQPINSDYISYKG